MNARPPPSSRPRVPRTAPANTRRGASRSSPPARSSSPPARPSLAARARSATRLPLGTLLSVITLVVALLGLAFLSLLWGSGGTGRGDEVALVVPAGATWSDVSAQLEERHAARRPSLLSIYLALFSSGPLQPGPHLLADNLTPRQLAQRLARDPDRDRAQVTVPEGWTRLQIARRLHEKHVCTEASFLEATTDATLLREFGIPADSVEGYLFPATYPLPIDSDPRQVVRQLKAEFDRRLLKLKATVPETSPARELGWTLQQIVTMASVVEREAAVDDERPLVASAFYNRFRDPTFTPKPPRLQSDATTAYGCQLLRERVPSCAGYRGRVTPEMNGDAANPYSTYVHAGLPPGPIANPGERSLQAALVPAATKFLYFVGKGGGRHAFSETLADHNAAVQRLREQKTH